MYILSSTLKHMGVRIRLNALTLTHSLTHTHTHADTHTHINVLTHTHKCTRTRALIQSRFVFLPLFLKSLCFGEMYFGRLGKPFQVIFKALRFSLYLQVCCTLQGFF